MLELATLLDALALEPTGDGRYKANNVPLGRSVVFGGQMLAQSVIAGARAQPGKQVRSMHTIFARAAKEEQPLEISVEEMHSGRAFGSVTVTISQGERLCARSLLLLDAAEEDLIRHAQEPPAVAGPDDTAMRQYQYAEYEMGVVDGIDVKDPDQVGPPELNVWVRFLTAPDDLAVNQALLAYASDGFLIGTAMLPHKGVGLAQKDIGMGTGVLTHTLSFHEPISASEWLLLAQKSDYAGGGRAWGRANVFTESGRLVASYVQDSMVRKPPPRSGAAG